MGSTITVGRTASAFRDPAGDVVYVLWENTYESNCFPHTPSWCCVGIGKIDATITHIFAMASNCEGGMLRSRGGDLTPEGYAGTWLKALQAPHPMLDADTRLIMSEPRVIRPLDYSASFKAEERADIIRVLREAGETDMAHSIQTEGVCSASLHANSAGLIALYEAQLVYAWKLVPSHLRPGELSKGDPALGFTLDPKRKAPLVRPDARKLRGDMGDREVLLQSSNGTWRTAGWQYAVVADYVRSLGEHGSQLPANYRTLIRVYRETLRQAPELRKASVTFDKTKLSDDQRKYSGAVLAKLEADPSSVPTDTGFTMPFNPALAYEQARFGAPVATWRLE